MSYSVRGFVKPSHPIHDIEVDNLGKAAAERLAADLSRFGFELVVIDQITRDHMLTYQMIRNGKIFHWNQEEQRYNDTDYEVTGTKFYSMVDRENLNDLKRWNKTLEDRYGDKAKRLECEKSPALQKTYAEAFGKYLAYQDTANSLARL